MVTLSPVEDVFILILIFSLLDRSIKFTSCMLTDTVISMNVRSKMSLSHIILDVVVVVVEYTRYSSSLFCSPSLSSLFFLFKLILILKKKVNLSEENERMYVYIHKYENSVSHICREDKMIWKNFVIKNEYVNIVE